MYATADFVMARFPALRRLVNRLFYQYLAGLDQHGDVRLMNYGYAALRPDAATLPLEGRDAADRYSLQLYRQVAGAIDLSGRDVLEVGSGRGGGASYVMRTLHPRSMTGVDFSSRAAAFCQRFYDVPGLRFRHGDAEKLPFDDASFDVVINVESSHCYGSMPRFLSEVARVLRPGGHLLWADHRSPSALPALMEAIDLAGFEVEAQERITPNVLAALGYQRERNRALIDHGVPRVARGIFYAFAGVEGTLIYDRFDSGALEYMRLVLRKR
jgi:SAM-dependent methyltransferase